MGYVVKYVWLGIADVSYHHYETNGSAFKIRDKIR